MHPSGDLMHHEHTILFVDDEVNILKSIQRLLRTEPVNVLCASRAKEALEILDRQALDLVVSDHKMPGMSGVALLERVAQQQPGAVCFLLSGWTQEIPPAELQAAGVRAVLSKPWDDAELKRQLSSALRG